MIIKDEFTADTVANAFALFGASFDNNDGRVRSGLRSAYNYIGASQPRICIESKTPKVVTVGDNSYVQMGIRVVVRPNFGKRKIYFHIALNEGMDEWSFYVVKQWGFKSKVIEIMEGLPLENITQVIEDTYDTLVKTEMQGFIPC
jgi:hypothetical protein